MVDRGFATAALILGVILGIAFGRRYQRAHGAYRNWQTVKKTVPGLKTLFYGFLRAAIGLGIVILIMVVLMGNLTANGSKSPSKPASPVVPTPTKTR